MYKWRYAGRPSATGVCSLKHWIEVVAKLVLFCLLAFPLPLAVSIGIAFPMLGVAVLSRDHLGSGALRKFGFCSRGAAMNAATTPQPLNFWIGEESHGLDDMVLQAGGCDHSSKALVSL